MNRETPLNMWIAQKAAVCCFSQMSCLSAELIDSVQSSSQATSNIKGVVITGKHQMEVYLSCQEEHSEVYSSLEIVALKPSRVTSQLIHMCSWNEGFLASWTECMSNLLYHLHRVVDAITMNLSTTCAWFGENSTAHVRFCDLARVCEQSDLKSR